MTSYDTDPFAAQSLSSASLSFSSGDSVFGQPGGPVCPAIRSTTKSISSVCSEGRGRSVKSKMDELVEEERAIMITITFTPGNRPPVHENAYHAEKSQQQIKWRANSNDKSSASTIHSVRSDRARSLPPQAKASCTPYGQEAFHQGGDVGKGDFTEVWIEPGAYHSDEEEV